MKTATTTYRRVCPRDLFNESKLLKCYGRLCLKILDGQTPVEMSYNDENTTRFNVELMQEGSLTITNLPIKIKDKQYLFKTTYNGKGNYPFYLQNGQADSYEDIEVFNDNGEFTEEFIEFTQNV
jgi:hypothetical protein